MARKFFSTYTVVVLALGGLIMTGCRSVPVDILSMSAPDSLQTNETGTFVVATNDDAKQPVSVSWDFGDTNSASGSSATHSFNRAGEYSVSATASNRKGKSTDSETSTIRVYNPPVPAEVVSLSASDMTPDTRTNVRFSASTNGDAPLTYSWDFGDGSNSSDATPSHTFGQPGSYSVGLSLSNRFGSDSRSISLTVDWYEAAICKEVTEFNAVFFGRNASVLSEDGRTAMDDNLEILSECPNMNVRVEGIAAPGERHAQELSEDRARAAEQYYTEHGIPASRIVSAGNGRASGMTSKKEGLSQYRRVDTIIVR